MPIEILHNIFVFSRFIGNLTRIRHARARRHSTSAAHSRSSPVNTADGVFRLADDLRRERVSEGVDRIMASPVAVDRRPIRVITGWHLPGRDHNDNGPPREDFILSAVCTEYAGTCRALVHGLLRSH